MPPSDYHVVKHPEGWAVERPKAKRASDVLDSQRDAIDRAHELAHGGVVYIHGINGKIRKERKGE